MTLEHTEEDKYVRIWDQPRYRKYSPGQKIINEILKKLDPKEGSSFIDFGVGCGRAAQEVQDRGYKITGVDFAYNCLDNGITVPLVLNNLWEPLDLKADYGICTDVMEHIPTAKVDKTLENISNCVPVCFFQIAMFQDNMGRMIGERLHLTVEDTMWWTTKLNNHFETVVTFGDQKNFKAIAYT